MSSAIKLTVPSHGEKITIADGKLQVPARPIVPFIEGDGTGPDIWRASCARARRRGRQGLRRQAPDPVDGGLRRAEIQRPVQHLAARRDRRACREYLVSIKGPLTTPIGGGIRSLNVALRQMLDLYVCLRPVRWFKGVPSPVRSPEKVDMVIFRENTEDIYVGIEFEAGSDENRKFRELFKQAFPKAYGKIRFPETSGHRHQARVAGRDRSASCAPRSSTRSTRSARASRSCTRATS
jgi:isocitrate dehydrogenase